MEAIIGFILGVLMSMFVIWFTGYEDKRYNKLIDNSSHIKKEDKDAD